MFGSLGYIAYLCIIKLCDMKKLLFVMTALLLNHLLMRAEGGTCGTNLTWDLTDGTLTISGTGDMKDYDYGALPWKGASEPIRKLVIEDGVTSIADRAFQDCSTLASISIPESVTSIEGEAFKGTAWYDSQPDGLVYAGMVAYHYKGELQSPNITLKEGTTGIGAYAFANYYDLASITIPSSVKRIGSLAFSYCYSLNSVKIPNSVTDIESWAFSYCEGLTSLTISNSVTKIKKYSFAGCKSLTSLTIPESVTSIEDGAFAGLNSLTTLTIPNNVTSLDYGAFMGCGMTSLVIGSGMHYIGAEVFKDCPNLTDVTCLAKVVAIKYGKEGIYAGKNAFSDTKIENCTLHVPESLIGTYRSTVPWSGFKNYVAISEGEIPEMPKCATPTITYKNGKVAFSCDTEGAEFISEISVPTTTKKYDREISLSITCMVSVYATKPGYINSDRATIKIQANNSLVGDVDGNGVVNVADHVKLSEIIMNQK